MDKLLVREDDFEARREHLKDLTDEQLKERFWSLADQVVEPLMKLAKNHTTPAIERSILLRMGFSSLEAKALVDKVLDHGLIAKGAGHVVYRAAELKKCSIRDAGLSLIEGELWSEVAHSFGVSKK